MRDNRICNFDFLNAQMEHSKLEDMVLNPELNADHDARYLNLANESVDVTDGTFDLTTTGGLSCGTIAAGLTLPISGGQGEFRNPSGPADIVLSTDETVGRRGGYRYTTGVGLASTSVVTDILSEITQATPSTLKGSMKLRVNTGDSVMTALELDDTGKGTFDNTVQAVTFTDGTLSITTGNIDGPDIDITAGTGDYSSSGTMSAGITDLASLTLNPLHADVETLVLEGFDVGGGASRGGNITWWDDETSAGGFNYINATQRLVFDSARQSDGSDNGNAWIAFADGAASFATGSFTISATGVASMASGSTIGTLTLADGSITDSSGSITFNDENLLTSGTLGAGATTLTGTLTVGVNQGGHDVKFWGATLDKELIWDASEDTLVIFGDLKVGGAVSGDIFTADVANAKVIIDNALSIEGGSITDSSGAIDFGDETLTTSGKITGTGDATLGGADAQFTLSQITVGPFKFPYLTSSFADALVFEGGMFLTQESASNCSIVWNQGGQINAKFFQLAQNDTGDSLALTQTGIGSPTFDISVDTNINNILTTADGRVVNTSRYTTTQTLGVSDHHVAGDTDGGAFTITLPAGVAGTEYRIANTGTSSNNLTIAPNGAELLIGVNSNFVLFDGEALHIVYEATEGWF